MPIDALFPHLEPIGELTDHSRMGLLAAFESVPDPRKKRGVRHRFSAILFVSVCAVLSVARSFAAIAEWAADTGTDAPHASTFRLGQVVGDEFDDAIGAWAAA
ncbi:hypothetical protein B2J88_45280 [Rhodococcus sp. SRB_17]|nr:hypothetical protein [Rhodococcus sp. SRB_17]